MEHEAFETALRELFAKEGRHALHMALRKQPVQVLRLMRVKGGGTPLPAPAPLTEEETDRRVVGVLRALGEERLARLLAKAREGEV
jgi:hypothetical protein